MGDSMGYVLFINTARRPYIIAISLVALSVLAGSLLLGFLGPQARIEDVDYAYGCPSNFSVSVFDPAQCHGVQLGKSGATYTHQLGPFEPSNTFWSAVMYPYRLNSKVQELDTEIIVQVSIAGRQEETDGLTE